MKFTKLAKSDKFEYMMLSRLIQDAKYFIEHPDLKHLWAKTLDEHINKMLEQYTKLDPKPEWTSEDEIYELADKMKESYKNHWNEVHPDNKIEAAIQQPNKPKPTTMLPDNMQWAWDPDAADWVAVLKDNNNTTPPLYDPNNQNVVNQTTNYMSNIKSATKMMKADWEDDEFDYAYYLNKFEKIVHPIVKQTSLPIKVGQSGRTIFIQIPNKEIDDKNKKQEFEQIINQILEQIRQYNPHFTTFGISGNTTGIGIMATEDNIGSGFYNEKPFKIDYYNKKHSSCLAEFLDGPRYSKEIKIEAGLIKDGLVKYAGFDFNKGTKYVITTKGLEVLRKASETEHNEALNEREKLAYLFGFNTDEVSTLDTTGKVIKSDDKPNKIKKINIESLKNKLYRAIKNDRKGLEDALDYVHIRIKNEEGGVTVYVSDELSYDGLMKLAEVINKVVQEIDKDAYFEPLDAGTLVSFVSDGTPLNFDASLHKTAKQWTICEADGTELGEVEADSKLDAKVKFGIEHPEYADSQSISAKEINAQYEQTTNTKEPYPNPSETPNDHIILENHDGWVNTADNHFEYTEEQKRLLPLFKLINEYVARKEVTTSDHPYNDEDMVVSGQAEIINKLEHEVKDLGFYCEPVAEVVDNPSVDGAIYSLKIFTK